MSSLPRSTRDRLVQLLLDQKSSDYPVDYAKLAEVLEYSSLEMLAFLKSVNAEFDTRISPVDLENLRGKNDFASLLAYSKVDFSRKSRSPVLSVVWNVLTPLTAILRQRLRRM